MRARSKLHQATHKPFFYRSNTCFSSQVIGGPAAHQNTASNNVQNKVCRVEELADRGAVRQNRADQHELLDALLLGSVNGLLSTWNRERVSFGACFAGYSILADFSG